MTQPGRRVIRGGAAARQAFDAIARAFAAVMDLAGTARHADPRQLLESLGGIEAATHWLGILLVRHLADGAGARQLEDETRVTSERVDAMRAAWSLTESRLPDGLSAAEYLNTLALEYQDAAAAAVPDGERRLIVEWHPGTPEACHVWLLSALYGALEAVADYDTLSQLERRAAGWTFLRFAKAVNPEDDDAGAFMFREQEWALVERSMFAFGRSVLAESVATRGLWRAGPRQLKMARQVSKSRIGIFEVTDRDGGQAVLRELATRRKLVVHEHSALEYETGFLALGRLIPFQKRVFLRSPGMVFLQPAPRSQIEELAAALGDLTDQGLPRGVAIEAIIAGLLGVRIPRDLPAAESSIEAEQLSYDLIEALDQHGLASTPPLDEVSPELRRVMSASPGRRVVGAQLDFTLAEWMGGLRRVAELPRPSRRGPRGRR